MEETTNYKLKKPGYSDPVDVKDLNDNMDSMDGIIKALADTVSGKADNTAAGASALINKLSTDSSTPVDADYYISQSVGGGTSTTSYQRRPMSALWAYIQSKLDANGYKGVESATHSPSTGGYIRFLEGTQICWGYKRVSRAFTAWGSVMSSDLFDPDITFEKPFINEPYVVASSYFSSGYPSCWVGDVHPTKTGIDKIEIFRGGSASTQNVAFEYIAVGRWK